MDGLMFCGVSGEELMARVGPAAYAGALARDGVRPMDFTGRPMNGYVFAGGPSIRTGPQLAGWVERCLVFVRTLPPKTPPKSPRSNS